MRRSCCREPLIPRPCSLKFTRLDSFTASSRSQILHVRAGFPPWGRPPATRKRQTSHAEQAPCHRPHSPLEEEEEEEEEEGEEGEEEEASFMSSEVSISTPQQCRKTFSHFANLSPIAKSSDGIRVKTTPNPRHNDENIHIQP